MSSSTFQHHRTRSQSRFPEFSDRPDRGFPTLERSQRSKSFDNRRDFWPSSDNTFSNNQPRARFAERGNRDSFFNDSITIPIKKGGITGASTGQEIISAVNETPQRAYRSAAEGLNSSENDDEWKSYDRTVRYHHQRTEFPPPVRQQQQQQQHYDEYSSRQHLDQPQIHALRYSESDYATQFQKQHQQKQHRSQRQQHQQQQQSHHYQRQQFYPTHESYHSQGQSEYGRHFDGRPPPQTYYDDDYVGASTFGRTTGGATANGHTNSGHRGGYYHHESSSYQREGGGGSGAHQYSYRHSNGYGGHSPSHYKSHYYSSHSGGGGLFGKHKSKRDSSLPLPRRPIAHHKVHCCCFSFKWPLWGYEPCDPPTPIFYSRKNIKPPPPRSPPQQPQNHFVPPPEPIPSNHLASNPQQQPQSG